MQPTNHEKSLHLGQSPKSNLPLVKDNGSYSSLKTKSTSFSTKGFGSGFVSKTCRFANHSAKTQIPGPGTYNSTYLNIKPHGTKAPDSLFAESRFTKHSTKTQIPGPGSYDQPSSFRVKDPHIKSSAFSKPTDSKSKFEPEQSPSYELPSSFTISFADKCSPSFRSTTKRIHTPDSISHHIIPPCSFPSSIHAYNSHSLEIIKHPKRPILAPTKQHALDRIEKQSRGRTPPPLPRTGRFGPSVNDSNSPQMAWPQKPSSRAADLARTVRPPLAPRIIPGTIDLVRSPGNAPHPKR